MNETMKVETNVVVRVWDQDWNLISEHKSHNAWTDAGLNVLRDWLSGDFSEHHIRYIGWGDTSGNEYARDLVTQRIKTTSKKLMIRQYLPSSSSANTYTLDTLRAYNEASGGTLFAEAVFEPLGITKTGSIQITVEWTHTFAGV
jgi:hypothetical protein